VNRLIFDPAFCINFNVSSGFRFEAVNAADGGVYRTVAMVTRWKLVLRVAPCSTAPCLDITSPSSTSSRPTAWHASSQSQPPTDLSGHGVNWLVRVSIAFIPDIFFWEGGISPPTKLTISPPPKQLPNCARNLFAAGTMNYSSLSNQKGASICLKCTTIHLAAGLHLDLLGDLIFCPDPLAAVGAYYMPEPRLTC